VAVYDPSTQSFRHRLECGSCAAVFWPYSSASFLSNSSPSPINRPLPRFASVRPALDSLLHIALRLIAQRWSALMHSSVYTPSTASWL
jgi:hypothetical protein